MSEVILWLALSLCAALPLFAYLAGHLNDAAPGMWIVCAMSWIIIANELAAPLKCLLKRRKPAHSPKGPRAG